MRLRCRQARTRNVSGSASRQYLVESGRQAACSCGCSLEQIREWRKRLLRWRLRQRTGCSRYRKWSRAQPHRSEAFASPYVGVTSQLKGGAQGCNRFVGIIRRILQSNVSPTGVVPRRKSEKAIKSGARRQTARPSSTRRASAPNGSRAASASETSASSRSRARATPSTPTNVALPAAASFPVGLPTVAASPSTSRRSSAIWKASPRMRP